MKPCNKRYTKRKGTCSLLRPKQLNCKLKLTLSEQSFNKQQ